MLAGLAACGSSGGGAASPNGGAEPVLTVGATPSKSSKMICGEAKGDIAETLGVKPTEVTKPTWTDDVYSCTYVYPTGSFTLSVKEVDGIPAAVRYLKDLKARLGVEPGARPPSLGQASFVSTGGGIVVQKDNKVLTIDVSRLPAEFGPDHVLRGDIALGVGGVIMGCWTGA